MADPIEITTHYNPHFEGLLVIQEETVKNLIQLLEVAGHEVTWTNELSPDYFEDQPE